MAGVHFYILNGGNRERTACHLAEKAVAQGHQVHIRTANAKATEALNELLWVFRDQAFLPHSVGASNAPHTPVSIHEQWLPDDRDLLINLAEDFPEEFASFTKITELVGPDDQSKSQGRQRFRAYKEKGIEPKHQQI